MSGRHARGEAKKQSVLDFADAEDGLLGSSLTLQEQFGGHREPGEISEREAPWARGSAIPGPVVRDFIVAADKTIGVRLLQRMGWRAGQGVGARVPLRGAHEGMAKAGIPIEAFDALTGEVTRAPEDLRVSIPPPKDDLYGLGFVRKVQEVLSTGRDRKATAYHVSDLFDRNNKSTIDSFVYDDEADAYSNYTKELEEGSAFEKEEVTLEEEDSGLLRHDVAKWVGSSTHSTSQTCPSDGRPVLEGFELSATFSPDHSAIPKVEVPESYVPSTSLFEEMVPKPRQSRWSDAPKAPLPSSEPMKEQELTPQEVLHATRIAEERRNLFSGLSEAFRSRFVTATSKLAQSSTNTDERMSGLKSADEFSAKIAERSETALDKEILENSKKSSEVKKEGRVTVAWTPVPLLCKRLNVPVPAKSSVPQMSIAPPPRDRGEELFEKHIGAYISVPADMKMELPQATPEADSIQEDLLVNAALSVTIRPEMKMLKSIFDSDSDSDDDANPTNAKIDEKLSLVAPGVVTESKEDTGEDGIGGASATPIEPSSSYLRKKYLDADANDKLTEDLSDKPVVSTGKIIFKKPTKSIAPSSQMVATEKESESSNSSRVKRKNVLSFSFDD